MSTEKSTPESMVAMAEALGVSREELANRVVDQITEMVMSGTRGGHETEDEGFASLIYEKAQGAIDRAVDKIAATTVIPKADEIINGFVLQRTTSWGETKGKPVSLTEYLVERAEAWIVEPVDLDGKSQKQGSRYGSWSAKTTRFEYLIENKIQYSIEIAMEKILKTSDRQLKQGLHSMIVERMNALASEITVTVAPTKKR